MNDINYFYYRENNQNITVAYRYNDNDTGVVASFARCSRRDQFNKRIGRQIASGRLETGRVTNIPLRVVQDTLKTQDTGYGAVAEYLRRAIRDQAMVIA